MDIVSIINKVNTKLFALMLMLFEILILLEAVIIVLPYLSTSFYKYISFIILLSIFIGLYGMHSNIVNKFKAWNMRLNNAKTEH